MTDAMGEAMPGTSLLKKLHLIMQEVERVEKRGRNDFHKYDYVKAEDVILQVRKLMVQHGVHLFSDVESVAHDAELTTIQTVHRFVDVDTGEAVRIHFSGVGADKGDKGIWKAVTGALKYVLTSTFLIPTGDDPEGDLSVDQRATEKSSGGEYVFTFGKHSGKKISEVPVDYLEFLAKKDGRDADEFRSEIARRK